MIKNPSIRNFTWLILCPVIVWGLWLFVSRPKLNSFEGMYTESEISYRKNYNDLVRKDLINGYSFLKKDAHSSVVFDNTFPFARTTLDENKTQQVIQLLNDSSSYEWGEYGTPEYAQIIIFYNAHSTPIGYSKINMMGEVDSYPYRALMKWGKLSKNRFKQFKKVIH